MGCPVGDLSKLLQTQGARIPGETGGYLEDPRLLQPSLMTAAQTLAQDLPKPCSALQGEEGEKGK